MRVKPQRIKVLEPETRFTPDLGRPCGVYAILGGLDQESSGAERQGRRLHGHGQRTGRGRLSSDPGLLMDVSGNPAGTEGVHANLARSEQIKILRTVHFSLPLSFLRN